MAANSITDINFIANKQSYQLLVVLTNGSSIVTGVRTKRILTTMLVTDNIKKFEYINELGKLYLTGTLVYTDTTGQISEFLNTQYVAAIVSLNKLKQEQDGSFKIEQADQENTFTHKFIVNNIQILNRQDSTIVYQLDLVSEYYFKLLSKVSYSNYDKTNEQIQEEGGILGIVKQCIASVFHKHESIKQNIQSIIDDDDERQIFSDGIILKYITRLNDNVFSVVEYLMNKLFYYETQQALDSMHFITYNEMLDKYRLVRLSNGQSMSTVHTIVLSMNKTSDESIFHARELNFGSVVKFPKSELYKSLFTKRMNTYNFVYNDFLNYDKDAKEHAQILNMNVLNTETEQVENTFKYTEVFLEKENTIQTGLSTVQHGSMWNNEFNMYNAFCKELTGDNALIVNTDGIIRRFPGDIAFVTIADDTPSNLEDEAAYKNSRMRYLQLKDTPWVISKVRHTISPEQGTFTQNLIMFRNFNFNL